LASIALINLILYCQLLSPTQLPIPVERCPVAFRIATTMLFIHVFAAILLSQEPDSRTSTAAPAAAPQDHAPAAPASSPSAPNTQPRTLPDTPVARTGSIVGTVTDITGGIVPDATVVLAGPLPRDHRDVATNDKGFFEFTAVEPGTYHVVAWAKGFSNWTSPPIVLNPGKAVIVTGCKLKVAEAKTSINVGYSSEQIANEQVKIQEKQRLFGIIPNFYVSYDPKAEPLTTKLKFRLALKVSIDPITFIGTGVVAGLEQAADHPDYVQGARGYGERFGSVYAGGVTDIMIGGAILPSLLHQDPRYFYQGTGTKKSRVLHAMSSPFICRGDNGKAQPNYSSIGGDLATSAIETAYYPASNRNAGTVFSNFLIDTGERVAAALAQEFIVRKLTPSAKKQK
jgi:hypothetical protein